MVEPQATRFWHAAVQSGLVDERALDACWKRIPEEKRTPDAVDRRLARKAVEMGYMTIWQAQQLLGGVRPQGLRYDKYVLQDLIGQGGMGRVYLAKDIRLNRRVALKVLSRERMNNPRALARFLREAKVGAQLQHENLVRIYDEGEAHGNRYLVMEYIEGKTVGRLVAEHGPLAPPVAARIARQVALGLDHLHQKGLLHRDVNPLNILVDREGAAKLTDLGLAIDLGEPEDVVTRDGATVGTFDYISPEQAKHSRSVDIRSDIYSLGCTLYHALAGRVPFPQPSLPEKLYAHQLVTPDSLSTVVAGVPPALEAVVKRMMSKAPEERYATPAAVAQALEPFQGGPAPLAQIETGPILPQLEPGASGLNGAAGLGPTPPGSNMDDIALPARAVATSPAAPYASDLLPTIPAIDFGPGPRLSDSLSMTRSQTGGGGGRGRLWIVVGGVVLIGAVLALAVSWRWAREMMSSPASPGAQKKAIAGADGSAMPTVEKSDIAVHWFDDDTETSEPTLHDAIRQAVGKSAEVILRNSRLMEIKATRPLVVSGGRVLIRAADGANPVIQVRLASETPFLKILSNASLTFRGLTFDFGPESSNSKKTPPVLVESAGSIAFDRCAFSTLGARRDARVLLTSGSATTVSGCWFAGFDEPIVIDAFARCEAKFQQSLFVGYKRGESPAGWALGLNDRGRAFRDTEKDLAGRRITFDRCTLIGAGLLEAKGFSDKSPLQVECVGTVVKGSALLNWPKDVRFPGGLKWTGKNNRYDLSGANWIVCDGQAIDGIPKGPTDLETWSAAVGREPGTTADPVRFVTDVPGMGVHDVKDFAVGGEDAKIAAADPELVGPGAKPVGGTNAPAH